MTRLVVIDKASQTYKVYDNRVCLATYVVTEKDSVITKEIVEQIRVAEYPNKA